MRAEFAFDIIITDLRLPGIDGSELVEAAVARYPDIIAIVVTGFGTVKDAVEAIKRGAADFVLKPWRNDKLIAAVAAAANITRSRREKETRHLDAVERSVIERALARHQGNISLAASELGLSRPALYRRMAKHGL